MVIEGNQTKMEELRAKFSDFKQIPIKNFETIKDPLEFYSYLMQRIQNSKRVFLACLVVGSGGHSKNLIDQLALRAAADKPTMMLIDKTRAHRNPQFMEYIASKNVLHIVRMVDMSHIPFLPNMFNEFLRVFHEKAYVFDDEICISGANLDDPYFDNRIDRYFTFKNQELVDEAFKSIFMRYSRYIPYEILQDCQKWMDKSISTSDDLNSASTFMFQFSGNREIDVIKKMLEEKHDELYIATAYLNFSYRHRGILSDRSFQLVTTSPSANTFNNFSFLGNIITNVYAYSSYITLKRLPKCKLFEYYRPGYSFHSKGMWIFSRGWCATLIGSTNMNQRSVWADSERNWMIISCDPAIIKKLREEVREMMAYSQRCTYSSLAKRKIRMIAIIAFYILNIFI